MRWVLLAPLLAGCTGSSDVAVFVPGPLDGSWIGRMVSQPEQFTAVVDTDRAGWIALHGNDLGAALAASAPVSARASQELGAFNADLGRISARAWVEAARAWEGRSGLPEASGVPLFAALAAREAGEDADASRWLAVAAASTDLRVAAAAKGVDAPDADGDNPLLTRLALHGALRSEGAPDGLLSAASDPLWREDIQQHERLLYDPMVYGTLAAAYARATPPTAGDAALLFSPCLTEADLAAQLAAEGAPGAVCAANALALLEVDGNLGDTDDPEAARLLVRALDAKLDTWQQTRMATANADGQALLAELRLVSRLRSAWLLALARQALGDDHPKQALALVQLAQDLEAPRAIGPVNAPGVFAVLAEANLRTGHTREALDALQVLSDAYPHAAGVDEIVGDLAILQGLDRRGDSKEN